MGSVFDVALVVDTLVRKKWWIVSALSTIRINLKASCSTLFVETAVDIQDAV
jgi:hypothetical protein